MQTILISGAANGLGEAFLSAYIDKPNTQIIAIDRQPIKSHQENIKSFVVDVTSEASIHQLTKYLQNRPIDLVIHSAGIRGLVPALEAQHPDDVAACETLDGMDLATLMRTFEINTAGTFLLLRALLPNLQASKNDAKVIVMSSRMGSVGNNEKPRPAAGAAYAYRASKAALNTLVRSFAVDVPDVTFVLCHPGRVETKLVKCREKGAISAEKSVVGILPLIEKWDKGDSGKFYDRFGEAIQW